MQDFKIIKYPRTPHLEGSRLQPGDEDLSQVRFSAIAGRHLVLEEKVDGANSAISFDAEGNMLLQSRGHYLTGGARERHYDLMKQWANVHLDRFWDVLGCRYIMYGEWLYAKHSVYYDALPHYFLEFDILDRETGQYLDTHSRQELTCQMPICSVPILASGSFNTIEDILSHLGLSHYITSEHLEHLAETARRLGLDAEQVCRQTETTSTMEGIYIKVEENGMVTDRLKFVRNTFLQTQEISDQAWLARTIIPNRLSVKLEALFDSDYPER